jgi:hypothetical protein
MAESKGLLGIFTNEHQLMEACREVKNRNYKNFDAFTPFPVHGLDEAMGIKRSAIPYVTFVAGLTGCTLGALLQWWTSAVDWPINIGGKPMAAWPAFVPVCFELTILLGGLSTAGALFYFCGLPNVKRTSIDLSFTDDRFGLFLGEDDALFNPSEWEAFLKKHGAVEVRRVGA